MANSQMWQLGFGSEKVYNVAYIGNDSMYFDEYIYLSEIQDNCKEWGCKAVLWDATSTFKQGEVNSDGSYRLF